MTVDSNGKVSASESASQSATIQAVVTAKNSVKDNVSISIIPQPSSITISFVTGASNWKQYNDGKYYVKKGNELKFKATVSPSSANQEVNVSIAKTNSSDYGNAEVKGINPTASGTEFIFNPIESGPATFKITVKSSKKTSVSKSIEFGVDDYIGSNVKPGDYVYYNSSTGKFKSVDCGLRQVYAPSSNGYEASDGVRSSSPRSPQAPSSAYTYVGVLGCTSLGDLDDDFLKLSLLTKCRNGSNATGLYEYNTFRKSYLPGLENATALHGIVIGTRQSGEVIFQSTTEEIAQVNDTYNNTGLYQYQLKGVVALSEYQSKKSGYGEFVKYGLLNYLLLNFYNTHLKNFEGYHVEPVSIVASMTTSVPKMTSGSSKRTTGWFLPSVGEWELIIPNLTVITNSFSASGSQADSFSASQYYWTPCEYDKDLSMHYRPSNSSNAFYYHGKNTSVGAGGGGSSKCIVRPMLYL